MAKRKREAAAAATATSADVPEKSQSNGKKVRIADKPVASSMKKSKAESKTKTEKPAKKEKTATIEEQTVEKPTKKEKQTEKPKKQSKTPAPKSSNAPVTLQIIAGTYDRILHGLAATITNDSVEFTDTFLLEPHTSSIRAVAVSPPSAPVKNQEQKVILASGSVDEQIKLYHLSAHPPTKAVLPAMPSLARKAVVENPHNRQLGSLLHHAAPVTSLQFPNRSKLLSASEDCTIAVTRTRDWSLLSTIKAPVPKAQGRPSGDTAPLGATPAGVNDFAIHPSMKLMISVGKGEKCMRLWNLVTGKKAGVLSFSRELLIDVGETKYSSGEGRRVCWGSTEKGGDEFAVTFERGVAIFGMDSKPRCRAVPEPRSKIHKVQYVGTEEEGEKDILAVSTEDGRVLFFSTREEDLIQPEEKDEKDEKKDSKDKTPTLPSAKLIAQIGGAAVNATGRVKDFVPLTAAELPGVFFFVTAGSDGAVRVWKLTEDELRGKAGESTQVGKMVGEYVTENRIICLTAFTMIPRPEGVVGGDVVEDLDAPEESESESESEDEEEE